MILSNIKTHIYMFFFYFLYWLCMDLKTIDSIWDPYDQEIFWLPTYTDILILQNIYYYLPKTTNCAGYLTAQAGIFLQNLMHATSCTYMRDMKSK